MLGFQVEKQRTLHPGSTKRERNDSRSHSSQSHSQYFFFLFSLIIFSYLQLQFYRDVKYVFLDRAFAFSLIKSLYFICSKKIEEKNSKLKLFQFQILRKEQQNLEKENGRNPKNLKKGNEQQNLMKGKWKKLYKPEEREQNDSRSHPQLFSVLSLLPHNFFYPCFNFIEESSRYFQIEHPLFH